MDFMKFKGPIEAQIKQMMEGELFVVDMERDEVWDLYLNSFPEGTNPIYRERREHDCSACRHFVKTMGLVVSIRDGRLETIWDAPGIDDPEYKAVARAVSRVVGSRSIRQPFRTWQPSFGQDKSVAEIDGNIVTFRHFCCDIPRGRNIGPSFYVAKNDVETRLGEMRTTKEVFEAGLRTLSVDALESVLDICSTGSLYRGDQYIGLVESFLRLKREFDAINTPHLIGELPRSMAEDLFIWSKVQSISEGLARIKNTAIGTLLSELSEGKELEDAVRRFETVIMAPTSYKRPTALVSKGMIRDAEAKVLELGYADSLDRRHARLSDLRASDLLFVDRSVKEHVSGSVFDEIETRPERQHDWSKVESIPIDDFVASVLPRASSVEVLYENRLAGNRVSLIAPVHAESKPMFRWGNAFSWTYVGEVADSIKQRVKQAGGNVTGDLCMRLAWHNYDDLDLHLLEPGGRHICYASKLSPSGGRLDVDMNAAGRRDSRTPVENIFYESERMLRKGAYHLFVNQYSKQESRDDGFEVEIDFKGKVTRFTYQKPVRGSVTVAKFSYSKDEGIKFLDGTMERTESSRTSWGLATEQWQRVSAVCLSPNYWGDNAFAGVKHFMFLLDGCVSDDQPRGFFNEFLSDELSAHRKVMEIVGGKKLVAPSEQQLSGLGFSSTKRDHLLVKVSGHVNRIFKVTI